MDASESAYQKYRKAVWSLSYRITGNAADADDIVQETFVKVLEKPPVGEGSEWKSWLLRVATNLSIDRLRRRKKTATDNWLPSPVDDIKNLDELHQLLPSSKAHSPLSSYDLEESLSFAFLLAMEALSPSQRAVLILRDVVELSTSETAAVTGMTSSVVRVTLHRARKVMKEYDKNRTKDRMARLRLMENVLQRFLSLMQDQDVSGLTNLLTENVVLVADGAGEVVALQKPMSGRENVLRLLMRLNAVYKERTTRQFVSMNYEPAILFRRYDVRPGHAEQFTMHLILDENNRIRRFSFVFAPGKLKHLSSVDVQNV